jgi:hypothetical protein
LDFQQRPPDAAIESGAGVADISGALLVRASLPADGQAVGPHQ